MQDWHSLVVQKEVRRSKVRCQKKRPMKKKLKNCVIPDLIYFFTSLRPAFASSPISIAILVYLYDLHGSNFHGFQKFQSLMNFICSNLQFLCTNCNKFLDLLVVYVCTNMCVYANKHILVNTEFCYS